MAGCLQLNVCSLTNIFRPPRSPTLWYPVNVQDSTYLSWKSPWIADTYSLIVLEAESPKSRKWQWQLLLDSLEGNLPCVPREASVLSVPFLHLVWRFPHATPTSLFVRNFLLLLTCVFTSSSMWVLIHRLYTKPSVIAWVRTLELTSILTLSPSQRCCFWLWSCLLVGAGRCAWTLSEGTRDNSTVLQDWENQSHHLHNTACQALLQPLSFTAHVMLTAVPTLQTRDKVTSQGHTTA